MALRRVSFLFFIFLLLINNIEKNGLNFLLLVHAVKMV